MPATRSSVYPTSPTQPLATFASRRSVVHSTRGMVACSQPLAARAGQHVLAAGGNAADAAVAVAAALNVTEPCQTGIGGDVFCLFYDAAARRVRALNGSGRSGQALDAEGMRKRLGVADGGGIPVRHPLAATVPGAAAGWVDVVERFGSGKLSLSEVLQPAIELAEEGYPVSEVTASVWALSEDLLLTASPNGRELLVADDRAAEKPRAPKPGEMFSSPTLANTFRTLGKEGKKGFYEGRIAEEIIKVLKDLGSELSLEDLKHHGDLPADEVDAVSIKFKGQGIAETHEQGVGDTTKASKGVELWEHPPNGQGLVALMALGILEKLEENGKIPHFKESEHNSAKYIHALVESLRIAFADARWWVSDPQTNKLPIEELISSNYLAKRAELFNPDKALQDLERGYPSRTSSDTVYFAVTDKHGNGCSFINSNYSGFGTCIIPKGCGFTLQNRGTSFSLQDGHPNVYAPRKRPYHTIIPAMLTNPSDNSLHTVYGVMGGAMQPQGHIQILFNMLTFKLNPQAAVDAPRFCIGAGMPEAGEIEDTTVYLEEGINEEVADELRKLGHKTKIVKGDERKVFGKSQVIRCHFEKNQLVYSGGSDPRGDGAALPA